MVAPFRPAPGGYTHLFVAVDKFTKWIEAKPVVTTTSTKATNFIEGIIHRFGVPHNIITDDSCNFTREVFRDFCNSWHIRLDYASVAHPRGNGQVDRANGAIL